MVPPKPNFASGPSCLRFDFQHSQKFSMEKIVNVAEINQQRCLVESGQWLENADRTHLVLAIGKLVLQKNIAAFLQNKLMIL